jgi:transglutaminase-like putative cysteine protease
MMRLNVSYQTSYSYSEAPRRVIQLLRVTPPSFTGQNVLDWRIDVDCDARLREGRDGFGNIIHMLYVGQPVHELLVSVAGTVLTEDRAGIVQNIPNDLPPPIFLRPTPLTVCDPALGAFAQDVASGNSATLDIMHDLSARIFRELRFDSDATDTGTTAAQAFAAGHGVCQDFAHIFIAVARSLRIPARYVSGHIFRRDGAIAQEAAHAWAEAWIEHLGWVAFDPANGISADESHIRVAVGLDYLDAAPFAGARAGGGAELLRVAVEVRDGRRPGPAQAQRQAQN